VIRGLELDDCAGVCVAQSRRKKKIVPGLGKAGCFLVIGPLMRTLVPRNPIPTVLAVGVKRPCRISVKDSAAEIGLFYRSIWTNIAQLVNRYSASMER
jgi:hypothetical protein